MGDSGCNYILELAKSLSLFLSLRFTVLLIGHLTCVCAGFTLSLSVKPVKKKSKNWSCKCGSGAWLATALLFFCSSSSPSHSFSLSLTHRSSISFFIRSSFIWLLSFSFFSLSRSLILILSVWTTRLNRIKTAETYPPSLSLILSFFSLPSLSVSFSLFFSFVLSHKGFWAAIKLKERTQSGGGIQETERQRKEKTNAREKENQRAKKRGEKEKESERGKWGESETGKFEILKALIERVRERKSTNVQRISGKRSSEHIEERESDWWDREWVSSH